MRPRASSRISSSSSGFTGSSYIFDSLFYFHCAVARELQRSQTFRRCLSADRERNCQNPFVVFVDQVACGFFFDSTNWRMPSEPSRSIRQVSSIQTRFLPKPRRFTSRVSLTVSPSRWRSAFFTGWRNPKPAHRASRRNNVDALNRGPSAKRSQRSQVSFRWASARATDRWIGQHLDPGKPSGLVRRGCKRA